MVRIHEGPPIAGCRGRRIWRRQRFRTPATRRTKTHSCSPRWVTACQFSLIASATLLVTPVIVAKASGRDDSYLIWMVFASLLVCGLSTIVQVRRLGPVVAGAVLPMFTAIFAIPFCITAVADGGPATLTALVQVSAVVQLAISRWLFILRRFVTPTVVGTVMMILSITLASVVFGLLDDASEAEPVAAPLTALATLVIVAALALRGSGLLRLWAPMIGIVGGCAVAAMFGIYSFDRVVHAPWIGLPQSAPGLGLDFGLSFWTLLPGFLFLGLIISIQANGAGIAVQRVSWRDDRAVDFRQVQRTLAGTGVSNLMAGLASRPGPRFDSGAATDRPSGARPAGPPPRWPPTTPGTAPDPPTPAAHTRSAAVCHGP